MYDKKTKGECWWNFLFFYLFIFFQLCSFSEGLPYNFTLCSIPARSDLRDDKFALNASFLFMIVWYSIHKMMHEGRKACIHLCANILCCEGCRLWAIQGTGCFYFHHSKVSNSVRMMAWGQNNTLGDSPCVCVCLCACWKRVHKVNRAVQRPLKGQVLKFKKGHI